MYNQATVLGRLVADPEMHEFDRKDGKKGNKCQFRVATTETWGPGKNQRRTEYHAIVVWGGGAVAAQKYCKKGSMVFATGELRSRAYKTKGGDNARYTEIHCRSVSFLGHARRKGGGSAEPVDPASIPDEDLGIDPDLEYDEDDAPEVPF